MGKLTDVETNAQQTGMHNCITLLQFRLENTDLKSKAKGLCDLPKEMSKLISTRKIHSESISKRHFKHIVIGKNFLVSYTQLSSENFGCAKASL